MGNNLKAVRLSKGLTQAQLSKQIGITTRHYQDIERSIKRGSINLWMKLSEALGESVAYLHQQSDESVSEVSHQ